MMYPRSAVAILALTGLAASSIGPANAFVSPSSARSVPSLDRTFTAASTSSSSALFVAFGSSGGAAGGDDGETFASALARGWRPERGSFAGLRRKDRASGTIRPMYEEETGAIMPDGGLSPCVIKVIGVGGGGCNAVSRQSLCCVHVCHVLCVVDVEEDQCQDTLMLQSMPAVASEGSSYCPHHWCSYLRGIVLLCVFSHV